MKEEDQQAALIEWAGWKYIEGCDHPYGWDNAELGKAAINLPNTCSLDVLHEMEKKLPAQNHFAYIANLTSVVAREEGFQPLCMSTAAQRREALLRTIGKWKD